MKLKMDHTQRLNLHALLGAQRAEVGSIRAIWAVQGRIALDPAKEFEFTDPEVARIKAALQTWDSYGADADRRWLEPLVEALFPADPRGYLPHRSRSPHWAVTA